MIETFAPFNFDLSARIFSIGHEQIRKYKDGKYWQVIRIDGKLILFNIRVVGDDLTLLVELESNREISNRDKEVAKKIVNSLFNLKLDLKEFYKEMKNDKIMFKLTKELKGLRNLTTPTVFEALINSIVEQQISLVVAHGIEINLIKAFGDTLKVYGKEYYAYPTPEKLSNASIERLRRNGLSQRKAEYIKEISQLVADRKIDLEKFKNYVDSNEIIKELDEIRGIGAWTAELTIIRGMNKLDVFPAVDLGLRRCVSHYYCKDKAISGEEARRIAERWGKWKGLAGFYLIMAYTLDIRI